MSVVSFSGNIYFQGIKACMNVSYFFLNFFFVIFLLSKATLNIGNKKVGT